MNQNLKQTFAAFFIAIFIMATGCSKKNTDGYFVDAVEKPIISLNGDWKINLNPSQEFWKDTITSNWAEVQVPGEVMMQGFLIKNEQPFAYKKAVQIPEDYKDKTVYLQFEGVYSYARVWVNGHFVRDHFGGFTQWKCDITPFVEAGKKAWVTVEVTDRADDISYASGYAKHQIAGILRSVNILAFPKNFPEQVQIETDLDEAYKNSELTVSGTLKNKGENSKITIQLFDASNNQIALKQSSVSINEKKAFQIKNTIANPKKWDAEHPNLYTLKVSYFEDDKLLFSEDTKFGFREVKVDGNQFLVNGNPVKLRGACRHDVHPTLGRVSTPEYELKDVLLAKESNMNYIRTSHYPPSDNFLKLCDEYGIYVEDETAVCFVINYRIKGYEAASKSQSDSTYTERYLSQIKEMVDTHRNHPSVVIWSIGNESVYGSNFQKSHDWIKENDTTRPVMFSYPGTAPDSVSVYQILSMHYPGTSGDLEQYKKETKGFGYPKMPVIFDEWAHVACYNNATIKEDTNIRDFWGQSLDKMWAKTFDADGGLGGAIWGMIDETFMLPKDLGGFGETWGRSGENDTSILGYEGNTVGYGEWGIVDVWRRKKPEFWNTKKAYSPIKLLKTKIEDYNPEQAIKIPVYNRFDHTNLNEVKIAYSYRGKTDTLAAFDLNPHQKGELVLPIKKWLPSEPVQVSFYDNSNTLIDSYKIRQKRIPETHSAPSVGKIEITDKSQSLIAHTSKGDFIIDKTSGLLTEILQKDNKLAFSGPYMVYRTKGEQLTYSSNAINTYGGKWQLEDFSCKINDNKIILNVQGTDDGIFITYTIEIGANGELSTSYSYKGLPQENVREIGVKYITNDVFDGLSWHRESYWSTYPKSHLSAPTGKVALYTDTLNHYRKEPKKPWTRDTKSFYYDGISDEHKEELTLIAKATKEQVIEYSLLQNDNKRISVMGQGDVSCRLAKETGKLELYLNNQIDYIDLNWGNYQRNILIKEGEYNGKSKLYFELNTN